MRDLHWHKEAEWSYMLKGKARITAVDEMGRTFADDVGEGDLWYFPPGIPHSIQGLESNVDGCEFLLVFDDENFSEDSTFLLTDWLAHTPRDVLAKNFRTSKDNLDGLPSKELYIFPASKPGSLEEDRKTGAGPVPNTFSHRLMQEAVQVLADRSASSTLRTSRLPRRSRRPWSNSSPAACANCIGTRTRTSGSITSKAKAA